MRTHYLCRMLQKCHRSYCTDASITPFEHEMTTAKPLKKSEKISKAMQAYLQRAEQHEKFMKEQVEDYDIGRRHLANIVGADPDRFTQQDIDSALRYLMPSSLYNRKARPQLKHPTQVFPPAKAVQFGQDGRPFHYLFYTGLPNYHEIMHMAAVKTENLKKSEEELLRNGVHSADASSPLNIRGSVWLTLEELKKHTLENISEHEYRRFLAIMDRLCEQPLAGKEQAFIDTYRKQLPKQTLSMDIQPPEVDENGREYSEAVGARKTSKSSVKILANGNGKFVVNGNDCIYESLPRFLDRLQVMTPLQYVGLLGKVDIDATVTGGGPSGQAGALRLAISRALCSFLQPAIIERMRLAGLLTRDPRVRERKKPGQEGARRKFAWRKR